MKPQPKISTASSGHEEHQHSLTLDMLPFRESARVTRVDARHPAARRLMEMGVIPGAELLVVRVAPLGDPLQVQVGDCCLALRRTEAAAISVMMK